MAWLLATFPSKEVSGEGTVRSRPRGRRVILRDCSHPRDPSVEELPLRSMPHTRDEMTPMCQRGASIVKEPGGMIEDRLAIMRMYTIRAR